MSDREKRDPELSLLSDKKPKPRTRWALIGVGAAFCAVAAAVYLVPRYFPDQTAAPVAVSVPGNVTGNAAVAVPNAATTALPPLYAPDAEAKRDLSLSYELKTAPAKP